MSLHTSSRPMASRLSVLLVSSFALILNSCEPESIDTPDLDPFIQVILTPNAVELEPGETATGVAQVTGGNANTDRAVTFTSSNQSVATVTSTGGSVTIHAVAVGTATVTAVSRADPAKSASMTVQVKAASTTLQIASIVDAATGQATNTASASGTLNVSVNATARPEKNVRRVDVKVDDETICSEEFSQPLGTATFTCPVNTADVNAQGIARFDNGQHTISAFARIGSGSVVAEANRPVTFNNANRIDLVVQADQGPEQDTLGNDWFGGNIRVEVAPVIFNGAQNRLASVTVNVKGEGIDATRTDATSADGFVVVFAKDTDLKDANGELTVTVPNTVTVAGNPGVSRTSDGEKLAVDNKPPVVQPVQMPQSRWVNEDFDFNPPGTPPPNDLGGVNRVSLSFFAGPPDGPMVPVSGAAQLPQTTTNNALVIQTKAVDRLGNVDSVFSDPFGVDTVNPKVTLAQTGVQDGATNPGVNATVDVLPTDNDGGSGIQELFASVRLGGPNVALNDACWFGFFQPNGNCDRATVQGNSLPIPPGNFYKIFDMVATDAAGNQSDALTVTVLSNNTPPSAGNVNASTSGTEVSVSATFTSNIDLWKADVYATYNFGGGPVTVHHHTETIGNFGLPFETNVTRAFNFPAIIALERTFVDGTINDQSAPAQSFNMRTFGQERLSSNFQFAPLTFTDTPASAKTKGVNRIVVSTDGGTLLPVGTRGPPCPDNVLKTVTVDVFGQGGSFVSPFTSVGLQVQGTVILPRQWTTDRPTEITDLNDGPEGRRIRAMFFNPTIPPATSRDIPPNVAAQILATLRGSDGGGVITGSIPVTTINCVPN